MRRGEGGGVEEQHKKMDNSGLNDSREVARDRNGQLPLAGCFTFPRYASVSQGRRSG